MSAILAALIGMLGAKGALTDEEVREVYEQALILLESHQVREIIEAQLRPEE